MSESQLPLKEWVEQCGGQVALVFADFVSSTAFIYRWGTTRYADLRREWISGANNSCQGNGGRLIDTAGDGLFYAFQNIELALRFAFELMSGLQLYGNSLRVRTGVHFGPVNVEGNELLGRNVHYAARVARHGLGPELWVSQAAKDALGPLSSFLSRDSELARRLGYPPGYWEFAWLTSEECLLHGIPEKQRLWRAA